MINNKLRRNQLVYFTKNRRKTEQLLPTFYYVFLIENLRI